MWAAGTEFIGLYLFELQSGMDRSPKGSYLFACGPVAIP